MERSINILVFIVILISLLVLIVIGCNKDQYNHLVKKIVGQENSQLESHEKHSLVLACVSIDNKYCYIDKTGKYLISQQFYDATPFFRRTGSC